MDWNDLQFLLAVDREGGLAGAARSLRINYSTAHRRLGLIERAVGTRLFTRRRDGYHLTAAARDISGLARNIEAEVLALERRIAGADAKLSGTVHVSTSQMVGIYVLPRMLQRFAASFPDVAVDVSISDELTDLTHSDTEVVVRATTSPPPYLSGVNLGPLAFAGYARRDASARRPQLNTYEWIDFVSKDPAHPQPRWLRSVHPVTECRYRFDSAVALCEAACAGLGAAALPCLIGENKPELMRLTDVRLEPTYNLWLLTHRDLRRSARIRSFMRFMQAELELSLSHIPGAKP